MPRQSGYKVIWEETRQAAEAMDKYKYVKLDSNGKIEYTDTQGEKAWGILLDNAAINTYPRVLRLGRCPLIITTAASLAVGDNVTASATTDDGKGEEAASGDFVNSVVVAAPAADDDQVEVDVNCVGFDIALA